MIHPDGSKMNIDYSSTRMAKRWERRLLSATPTYRRGYAGLRTPRRKKLGAGYAS